MKEADSDAHNNLGTAFVAEGRIEQALSNYRIAVADAPDSITANFNLGLTLAGQGKVVEAAPYLRKAAQSPDPQVRDAAIKLLKGSPTR